MLMFVVTLIVIALEIDASTNSIYPTTKEMSTSLAYYTHSHTKAVCDENNYCRDYEIFCKNNDLIEMRFTGAAVQFAEDWKDPREEAAIKSFC